MPALGINEEFIETLAWLCEATTFYPNCSNSLGRICPKEFKGLRLSRMEGSGMSSMYFYIKAFHIISLISWMAGMLYLPRLYVYHAGAIPGGEASEMLKVMERKLLRGIMLPAMIATWVFGLWLANLYGFANLAHEGWFHAKLLLVIGLSGYHGWMSKLRKDFAADRNMHSARFYRVINEIPAVLLVIIVLLVVIKPF